jgi:hypothetical protein
MCYCVWARWPWSLLLSKLAVRCVWIHVVRPVFVVDVAIEAVRGDAILSWEWQPILRLDLGGCYGQRRRATGWVTVESIRADVVQFYFRISTVTTAERGPNEM